MIEMSIVLGGIIIIMLLTKWLVITATDTNEIKRRNNKYKEFNNE